ncbi:nuclear transport factor 2 family protein [Acidocella sp. KAb 2-4]|uniref:nuclear transport factor 2 family protein n=1 Tax=Acidocella sp. KAb 2-4 TaxID=2885158 RepID=UPI001D06CDC0|nr:nuclear transport factor 2 family protein [Acidocella sp. KAb 2-4]MCB5945549.1 nuclear transport factor 2 family protein [Acidocella sp. KAb 2-4]
MRDDMARLRAAADRQEIEQQIRRYCRAIDRLDVELLRSLYHPDGVDLHGSFEGNAHEFADFIMVRLKRLTTYGFHTITQSIIDVDGDAAAAESTYVAYHRIAPGWEPVSTFFGEGYAAAARAAGTLDREHENSCGGRYLDRFERRADGVWRIKRRRITNEWNRNGVTTHLYAEGELANYNLPGARDRSDPVYEILLNGR